MDHVVYAHRELCASVIILDASFFIEMELLCENLILSNSSTKMLKLYSYQ